MRTYEQMRQEREETERPIVITEHEWWIVQNHWLKEDAIDGVESVDLPYMARAGE